jgi:hypothetical protein
MNQHKALTREQLHEIAVRRRGDADVRALMLEIKRLRELAVAAFRRGSSVFSYTEDPHEAYLKERFAELFEDEPAVLEAMATPKLRLPGPERRFPYLSPEREAKLLSRIRRS